MSSFTRTQSGLNGYAAHFGVDYVILTEGSEDLLSLKLNPDKVFWKAIFAAIRPDLKIKVISQGSKSGLQELGAQIDRTNPNYIIAMDSDFDRERNNFLEHKNVLYTKNYSWESDLWSVKIIDAALLGYTGDKNIDHLNLSLRTKFAEFLRLAGRVASAECALYENSCELVFDREANSARYLEFDLKKEKLNLNKVEVLKRITELKKDLSFTKIYRKTKRRYSGDQIIYGKLVAQFGYCAFRLILKEIGEVASISYNNCSVLMLGLFPKILTDLPHCEVSIHYRTLLSRI